jgi:uncharacterized protein (DUF779 family)
MQRTEVSDDGRGYRGGGGSAASLSGRHGPSMFYQSGGCCDGSLPKCYAAGECLTGDAKCRLRDLPHRRGNS